MPLNKINQTKSNQTYYFICCLQLNSLLNLFCSHGHSANVVASILMSLSRFLYTAFPFVSIFYLHLWLFQIDSLNSWNISHHSCDFFPSLCLCFYSYNFQSLKLSQMFPSIRSPQISRPLSFSNLFSGLILRGFNGPKIYQRKSKERINWKIMKSNKDEDIISFFSWRNLFSLS